MNPWEDFPFGTFGRCKWFHQGKEMERTVTACNGGCGRSTYNNCYGTKVKPVGNIS